jgi:predicted RNA-binding protein associated with RNAse of E/G family
MNYQFKSVTFFFIVDQYSTVEFYKRRNMPADYQFSDVTLKCNGVAKLLIEAIRKQQDPLN